MTFSVILLIIMAALVAAALSYYQYYFKAGSRSKATLLPASLRFITVFAILLLLINPRISRTSYQIEKTPLPLVMDNSESVYELKASESAMAVYNTLSGDGRIQDKFDVQSYVFDQDFTLSDSFAFKGTQTNVEVAAKSLKSIYRNRKFPTVLISDGNQTTGGDYVYAFGDQNKVYPIVVGDTTTFPDLRIAQLNVNKYAFLKNKFPAEVFLQYAGNKTITANFTISSGAATIAKQSVTFSPSKRSAVVNVLLPAEKVGVQTFKAAIRSSEPERNTYNNTKNFAVEIIDQKTEVAIVSTINHPDLGALKRAIETNVQRKLTIVKPSEIKTLDKYNVLIMYQPTAAFKQIFEASRNAGINSFIISGVYTDFSFLNSQQQDLEFKMSNQREDYMATFDSQFNLFAAEDIGFGALPPLQHGFGTVVAKNNVNVLLRSRIRNIETANPLLAFAESNGRRTAYLLGENIWKWRLQSHVNNGNFEKFDMFVDKTIQFLSSDNARKSLVVQHERFYNSGDAIEVTAQYFNKNYEFDERARLSIAVTNSATRKVTRYDLLKGSNTFKADLDGLPAGKYTFTVSELNSKSKYSAGFEILDFNIEKQFVNPDVRKMSQLAMQTDGAMFTPDQMEKLIKTLLDNEEYKAVQKSIVNKIPLIDSMILLIFLAISLASEWFIRKYNGML